MAILSSVFFFTPVLLILHCQFILLFKKWLGATGTFYTSLGVFSFSLSLNLIELYKILVQGHYYYIDLGRWFSCLDLIDSHWGFCIDSLSLTCASLVLTLTCFALYFGIEYMYREAFINRLLYLLNMFATSVILLFFSYDFFMILVSWECIGLFSLLLVNFYSTRIYTIKAAQKTFVWSRVSDMFMFLTFFLTIIFFESTDLSIMFLQIPFMSFHYVFIGHIGFHFLTFFSTMLVISGGIKAAQFFSHVWLPDAMEAPTPASALIHSSTLVVAGVFLIIRFSILFEFALFTNYFLVIIGALTLAFGAVSAAFQSDIKKLVAYSTISQIGYLVCGCGFCCYEEVLIYLIVHALNKAFLFVLVGYAVHFFNANTDMRQMGAVHINAFDITILLFGACLNLAGLPYSAGFLGKECLLFQVMRDDFISLLVRGCWMVSFFFTPIYMFVLIFEVPFGTKRGTIASYCTAWYPFYATSVLILMNRFFNLPVQTKGYYKDPLFLLYRFQHTALTSRLTIYILALFWCFFFFFGESLMLITFNYSTLIDLIPSSSFTTIKSHILFYTYSSNASLGNLITFFIIFFTISAVVFLINIRFPFSYTYSKTNVKLDLIALLVIWCAYWPLLSTLSYPVIIAIFILAFRYTAFMRTYVAMGLNVVRGCLKLLKKK